LAAFRRVCAPKMAGLQREPSRNCSYCPLAIFNSFGVRCGVHSFSETT
jgi:hypothetical protein